MTFHMSVTKQEAVFLKEILARHLEDFVEELVREEKNPDRLQARKPIATTLGVIHTRKKF